MTLYRENSYRHGVGWSIWHLEWITKYRRKIFKDENLKKLCGIAFNEAAKRYRFRLVEYEIQPDHVHTLLWLRPSMSASKAMNLIKGYTSRLMWILAEESLGKWYLSSKDRSLWSDGKFYGSVGHITLEKAKEYLENQKAHHAKAPVKNPYPLG